MEKEQILHVLSELREKSPKRTFTQSFDLIFNLQGLDLKKPEQKVDFYLNLPHKRGKKITSCAFVDATLEKTARGVFDRLIIKEEFSKWNGKKKEQKKLAEQCTFFVAQTDLMTQVAATFGKVLGPKGKMPNPKAGCVISTTTPLQPLITRLSTLVRVQTKNDLSVKVLIGIETLKDEELADNILAVYNTLLSKLPQEKNNIKNTLLKLTMGPAFKLDTSTKKTEEKKRK